MSLEKVREELLDGGLHEQSVKRLLDHYQSMQTRMREGEYDEAGTHIGNFCENMVNVLRDQMGEPVESRPNVGKFVNECTSGKFGTTELDSIRLQIPNMLRAAYDIRNNRDSVHVNLQVPVNHADTQTGIAMCSWMLAEVLRVYGTSTNTNGMEEVGELIDELAQPITDGNPLEKLETSSEGFDRHELAETIGGYIQVLQDDGKVCPDQAFTVLSTKEQVIALLLGRRAAEDLGHIEEVGVQTRWISEFVDVSDTRVRQITKEVESIHKDDNSGGYHIPGFRIQEAVNRLKND